MIWEIVAKLGFVSIYEDCFLSAFKARKNSYFSIIFNLKFHEYSEKSQTHAQSKWFFLFDRDASIWRRNVISNANWRHCFDRNYSHNMYRFCQYDYGHFKSLVNLNDKTSPQEHRSSLNEHNHRLGIPFYVWSINMACKPLRFHQILRCHFYLNPLNKWNRLLLQ